MKPSGNARTYRRVAASLDDGAGGLAAPQRAAHARCPAVVVPTGETR